MPTCFSLLFSLLQAGGSTPAALATAVSTGARTITGARTAQLATGQTLVLSGAQGHATVGVAGISGRQS
ncbi:MAG TPA: hypothetical protein V6C50_06770 [Crinalium sp.]